MKKLLFIFLVCSARVEAANWYINAAVGSSGNGLAWDTAWKQPSNVSWGSVSAGDTIWIAGGSYTAGFQTGKNGSAGNYVHIKRPTLGDSAATSSSGWSSGYASQVTITDAPGVWFDTSNVGRYMYFDGRVTNGIKFAYVDGASFGNGGILFTVGGMHDLIFTNCEIAGPGGNTPFNYVGDHAGVGDRHSIGGGAGIYNLLITHSYIHGDANLVYVNSSGSHDWMFYNTTFKDCASSSGSVHANMVYQNSGVSNLNFFFCDFSNWQIEGINIFNQAAPNSPTTVYGSIFHDYMSGQDFAHCFWLGSTGGSTPQGPLHLVNNTFVDVPVTIGEDRASQFGSTSVVKNNIFWNASFDTDSAIPSAANYNFSSGSTTGGNSISSGTNPFVDYAGKNYAIKTNISSSYPHTKGEVQSAPWDTIANGSQRAVGGLVDMGYYQIQASLTTNSIWNIGTLVIGQ